MELLQKRHEPSPAGGGDLPEAGGDALALARAEAQRVTDAADAATNRALMGDSRTFLASARQQGGQ